MRSLFFLFMIFSSLLLGCADKVDSTTLKLTYIALDDNGASGPALGCGDSEVLIEKKHPESLTPEERIQTALESLFADKEQFKKDSGLYNAIYQSTLTVDSITIDPKTVTVNLSGTKQSGGVCDDPRIVTQITSTIKNNLNNEQNTSIIIHLNGTPLENIQDLSGQ